MSILIITNKSDITSDFIVKNLSQRRLPFYRLNTEDIGRSILVNFDFVAEKFLLKDLRLDLEIDLRSIKSVYYRRPEVNNLYTDVTKGELNFIRSELLFTLEGIYKILDDAFWVNKVYAIRNAENKIFQLLVAKELGFSIPPSLVTSSPHEALHFFQEYDSDCIIKPIKSGLVEGDVEEGVIFTTKVYLDNENVDRLIGFPVYLQKLIYKHADIRVTIVGNEAYAAMIHSQGNIESEIDWRKSSQPLPHSIYELPKAEVDRCISLTKRLGLNYGAIDFILDENENLHFLEINPNGQWAWIENRLNLNISDGITELLARNLET
ncbi:MvdC/MvdD family ATP grasp protein [Mucilaginibacter celer]|uniref:ATP-grasp domain-containing protein n=1 Tax=Mucilaginibacter celer TaxID=2305508 RepID=A0A494VMI2_9SPHI|nr:hypothetical protein [Mucilaginibacter celer]AYL96527.1 hypothetical protein HYN43_015005 [Mucilaginibacter celer]